MNPAQLLNPKGFAKEAAKKRKPNYGPQQSRKPASSDSSDVKVVLPSYDPKALLDPKSGSTGLAAKNMDAQNPEDRQETNLGRLYEKHHNVKNRDASVAVKRKSTEAADESDEERKKQKTSFGAGGRGGIISDHLKKEREALSSNGAPDSGPIDLTTTSEKDDDVVIVSEKTKPIVSDEKALVCMGMIDCKAVCHRVPFPSIKAKNPSGHTTWPNMKVTLFRDKTRGKDIVIDVRDSNDKEFGKVDLNTAAGMAPLMDGSHINGLKIRAWIKGRLRKNGEEPGQPMSGTLEMMMALYAPRNRADQVGQWLSNKQLFLRDPPNHPAFLAGRELYNPHQIKKDHRPQAIINGVRVKAPTTQTVTYSVKTIEEKEATYNKLFDDLSNRQELPQMETDVDVIKTDLLTHQKQALHFMFEHEEEDFTTSQGGSSSVKLWVQQDRPGRTVWHNLITEQDVAEKPEPTRGGILADMMGLGKTLSILALIASTKRQAKDFKKLEAPEDLGDQGANMKATLIICPNSVLSNWEDQVRNHVFKDKLRVYVYHGPDRAQDAAELSKYNIILSTYGTLASDFKLTKNRRRALFRFNWFRVVLDEAHAIRNSATAYYKSACGLLAQRRWAVTGTPVQNRLEDLGALIAFLKVKPFDEPQAWNQYIIAPFKTANQHIITVLRILVDSITLRRTKEALNESLPDRKEVIVRLAFSEVEQKLYSQFAARSNTKLQALVRENKALRGKSYMHILKSLLRLRMISVHGREMLSEDDLEDIKGSDESNVIDLGDEPELAESWTTERQAYDCLNMQCDANMDHCSMCGDKIVTSASDAITPEAENDDLDEEEIATRDNDVLGVLTPCLHLLHAKCHKHYMEEYGHTIKADGYHACPYCDSWIRAQFFSLTASGLAVFKEEKLRKARAKKTANINPETYVPSTKVNELIKELQKSATETLKLSKGEPPIRSVVFTEWTTNMDLIGIGLDLAGISYIRLDGSMSLRARAEVIARFRDDPKATVLLVSIRAGGQGLNFTSASKVYLMEPQWNPGVEQQAVDRVHRLGQKRDVEITHFIMTDSVEEGLLKLQDKKIKLASLSMDKKRRTGAEETKQRLEEIRDLFK